MAQSSTGFVVANGAGSTVRAGINSEIAALSTHSSGGSAPSSPRAHQTWADTSTGILWKRNNSNTIWVPWGFIDEVNGVGSVLEPRTQCRFGFVSTTQVALVPFGGNRVLLPSVSSNPKMVTLSSVVASPTSTFVAGTGATALTASHNYLVALFDNAGTPTLDFLDTATFSWVLDTVTGLPVKKAIGGGSYAAPTGAIDSTRLIVGMVRAVAGPLFSSNPGLVRSYFNRPRAIAASSLTSDQGITSTTYVEVNTVLRTEFLMWLDEAPLLSAQGKLDGSTSSMVVQAALGIDGTTPEVGNETYSVQSAAAVRTGLSNFSGRHGLTEGYHYLTLLGLTSLGTLTFAGTANDDTRTTVRVII